MKFKAPGFLALLLFLAAAPLVAQVNDTYVIPAVGNLRGDGNTRWMTEIHVFNPQRHALVVTAVYLPSYEGFGDPPVPVSFEFDVAANSTAWSPNILEDLFKTTGRGALLLTVLPEENPGVPNNVLARSFVVTTRTYNNASSGTFGQAIPGVFVGLQDYDTDEISAIATGIRNFGYAGFNGFRTNIGAANLGRYSATLYITVFDEQGNVVRENVPFVIPPQGHIQERLPWDVDHGSIEFYVDDPRQDAVVMAYASVVDNRSGDSVYVNPILLASARTVYPKGAAAPAEVGKKITIDDARAILAKAQRRGKAELRQSSS